MALNQQQRKLILLSSLGGALEFYDFIIFSIFAPIMGEIFFPQTDTLAALINVYAIFAIGYLIRPLGGLVFSHFGDKYGRKTTFISSIMLMAIPTFFIGLIPTYQTIGTSAAFLLIALRILQGLSIGGEIPGAFTYTAEHVEQNARGMLSGIIFAFFNLGFALGTVMSLILTSLLSHDTLLAWGWRIPFLFGGVLGIISFYLRKQMTESPIYTNYIQSNQQKTVPIIEVLRQHWRAVLQGAALAGLSAVFINLLFVYLPTYLNKLLFYPKQQVDLINTFNLLFDSLFLILVGALSDKIGRRRIIIFGALGFVCCSYFLFDQLNIISLERLMLIMIMFSLMGSCINIFPAILVNLFPTSVRYTGIAITYNIGFAFFGGLTPLISTYLIQITTNKLAPSFYLIVSAIFCLLATFTLKSSERYPVLQGAK